MILKGATPSRPGFARPNRHTQVASLRPLRRCWVSLAAAVGFVWFAGSGRAAVLLAADNADNDPYPETNFQVGDNGGFGFQPWVELEQGTVFGRFVTSPVDGGTYSWGISGRYALGRELTTRQAAGSWSLIALHDPHNAGFSGFNIKSSTASGFATDELLRFGLLGGGGTGIYVSTDGGQNYTFLDCDWTDGTGDRLQYTVSWQAGGSYALSVLNLSEDRSADFTGTMTPGAVAMLGTAVFGEGLDERITFDAYEVVPEPAPVLPLMVVVSLAVAWEFRRRKRTG